MKTRRIISIIVALASIALATWLGGWVLFARPIIDACKAFDAGTLNALMVGITILKCLCGSAVASLIIWLGTMASGFIVINPSRRIIRKK